eukprot:scaffold2232_cov170-Amphora_coffeaeformis.AAC.1
MVTNDKGRDCGVNGGDIPRMANPKARPTAGGHWEANVLVTKKSCPDVDPIEQCTPPVTGSCRLTVYPRARSLSTGNKPGGASSSSLG